MKRLLLICLLLTLAFITAGAAKSPRKGDKAKPSTKGKTIDKAAVTASVKQIRVAVLELGMLGMSNDERRSLELLLRNSIATIEGVLVIPTVDVQMALSDPKNAAAAQCAGGPECAVIVGRVVGAERVVFGTLSTIGDAFSMNLRVMDTKSGKEVSREQSRTSGDRNVLIPELRLAAYRLVAPDKILSTLEIESSVAGVEIEVNGIRVGTTPLAEPVTVTPGDQLVVARRPGYSEFQREVTLKPFERLKVRLDLGKGN